MKKNEDTNALEKHERPEEGQPNTCGFDIVVDNVPRPEPKASETTTTTTTTTTQVPYNFTATTPPPPIIEQQMFLGASIVNFSVNAGFGDSVSQLSVTLAEDPVQNDNFNFHKVKVGEPVYFSFGTKQRNPRHENAQTGRSFYSAIDDLYRVNKPIYNSNVDPLSYKYDHFAFGGLFQSWDYNKDATSGQIYNVNVVDPREILAGVQLLLNNYAGTTLQNTNMLNIFGFLEHENETQKPSWTFESFISRLYPQAECVNGRSLCSFTFPKRDFPGKVFTGLNPSPRLASNSQFAQQNALIQGRPITGEGMSLRSSSGIPFFRVAQAFNSLMGFHQYPVTIGDQYSQYGGYIKFRGHYYLVDLTDIPLPDPYYMLNYDTVNLLELCLELCEVANHELAVSLLPLVPRDGTVLKSYENNFTRQYYRDDGSVERPDDELNPGVKISGVIKITTVNRNSSSGEVSADYIESLPFYTQSTDIGQELANEVTDKFVTGGKEVNMYYFDSSYDNEPFTRHGMHKLVKTQQKQVIPYYGKLANGTVTLPRGVGPWTQILLDSSSVKAAGVGKYYVATELELRAVDISFDKWVEFLQNYNILWMEKTKAGAIIDGPNDNNESDAVQITVPQCVWPPHSDDYDRWVLNPGECSPPYGYPLYYGRATALGLSAGGATGMNANNPRKTDDDKGVQKDPSKKNDNANASRDASKAYDVVNMGFYALDGVDNAKVVYAFLKNIVDECLGTKYLVKIPQITNNGFGLGVPYGFIPRDQWGDADSKYVNGGGVNVWNSQKKNLMLDTPFAQEWRENGALQIGYNFNAGNFEFSYTPEPAGGRDPAIPYTRSDGSQGVRELPLSPPLIQSFFSENGRTPPYVMYPVAYKEMNVSALDPNSYVMYDIQNQAFDSYTTPPPGVQDGFITRPQALFVKAELESEYLFGPVVCTSGCAVFGQGYERVEEITEDEIDFLKLSDNEEVITEFIRPKLYIPYKTAGGSASVYTIDVHKTSAGISANYYDPVNGGVDVYALITLPRVAYTEDGRYREGYANKVNLANLTHYLREDVVMGMPGIDNAVATLPESWAVEDFDNGEANEEAVLKAVEGLTFSLNRRINMASPGPVIPFRVGLPLASNRRTYGPWLSSTTDNGKVEYVQDDSLTPWDMDGYENMNRLGNLLASRTVDSDLDNERAAFTIVGWPSGLTVASLLNNGPAITNLSLDFGVDGVTTTVTMDSYTPSFGKMQKQKADQLRKVSRLGKEMKAQRNELIRNQIINNKSGFSFAKAQKQLKDYADQRIRNYDYGSTSSTPMQRGEAENANIMTFDHQPTKAILNGTVYDPDAPPEGDFAASGLAVTNSAMQSARQLSETSALIAQSRFNYHKQYFNSVATSTEEMFLPASYTWHYLLPNIKQPIDRILYIDDIDNDDDVSYYD